MAIKLFWSKRADQGYARIVKYLEEEWTEKEVQNFVRDTKHFFDLLQLKPSHPGTICNTQRLLSGSY